MDVKNTPKKRQQTNEFIGGDKQSMQLHTHWKNHCYILADIPINIQEISTTKSLGSNEKPKRNYLAAKTKIKTSG